MRWHPHADDNQVNLGMPHHGFDVVEGEWRTELLRCLLGGLHMIRAYRPQFEFGQLRQRWEVGTGAPPIVHIRSHDPHPNRFACHEYPRPSPTRKRRESIPKHAIWAAAGVARGDQDPMGTALGTGPATTVCRSRRIREQVRPIF